jgi:hypothetical protein
VTYDGCPLWEHGNPLPAPRPTAFWPIGYPLFLAGVFSLTRGLDPLLAAELANVALSLALMATLAWCARRIFRSKLAARLTLVLLAFLPNHIAYLTITSSEVLFVTLASLAIALLIAASENERLWLRLTAGLMFGLATMIKPQAVLLPPLLLLVLHFREPVRLMRAGALVLVMVALTLAPLWVRNHRAFGRFVFVSTNGGINLLIGNLPGAYAPGVFWNRELTDLVRSDASEVERDVRARAMAERWMRSHPLEVVAQLPKKFFTLYAADYDGFGWNSAADERFQKSPLVRPLKLGSEIYYLVIGALALLSWRHRRRFDPALYGIGPALFVFISAVYLAIFGASRFHFPLVPWLAVYAAATLATMLEREPT